MSTTRQASTQKTLATATGIRTAEAAMAILLGGLIGTIVAFAVPLAIAPVWVALIVTAVSAFVIHTLVSSVRRRYLE